MAGALWQNNWGGGELWLDIAGGFKECKYNVLLLPHGILKEIYSNTQIFGWLCWV